MVLIDSLVFALYRWLAVPLAIVFLKSFRWALGSKMREMIEDRSFRNLQHLPAKPLWIHASSGEIEYAKSVIRSLKEKWPQIPILVTYFSPSAKKLIQRFPGIDLAMALPWDRPSDLNRFLDFYKPRACLIARTDVWPEMSRQVRKRKIPSVLFSATFASESSRRSLLASSLTREALNSLSQIFCVSPEDRENLRELGIQVPCDVTGDTRFDQVLHRLEHPHPVKNQLKPQNGGKIFVMGSTWPADEEILMAALPSWIRSGGRAILAPHEVAPSRIEKLRETLQNLDLTVQTYRESEEWTSQILLVDQVGCLQELYTWGHLAFVGGSFKDKVHSVMEPLCAGLPVCVGPFHRNNREAIQFQHTVLSTGVFGVNVIQNGQDLELLMKRVYELDSPSAALREQVRRVSGSTAQLLLWLQSRPEFGFESRSHQIPPT